MMVRKMPACAAAPNRNSFGIGQQRPEVDHRADADEQQQRERLARLNAGFKQPLDDAVCLAHALCDLVDHARHRQVDQDRAKAHGQQQRRLILLFDRQPDEQAADQVHDHLLPRDGKQALIQKFHKYSPSTRNSNEVPAAPENAA